MIKVGFIIDSSEELMGKSNYLKNLIFAIDSIKAKNIKVIVFIGKKTNTEIKNFYKRYANVVEDVMFDKKSIKWYLTKIESRILRSNMFLEYFLKKHDVQIISHSSVINLRYIKMINWIPDFQHIHLAHLFYKKEIKKLDQHFKRIIKKSNIVLLSSYDSLKDFKNFDYQNKHKAKVLQFVSQPHKIYFKLDLKDKKKILNKFNIKNDFFYIPNQYWSHKNHMFVFKAINELKKEGIKIHAICTGYPDDHRNKSHFQNLKTYINEHDLNEDIRILGLVKYEEVFSLIKFSKAVINPSLFEGWSSTVEECKSVGKNMILSDLDVHKEQYPTATFFDKNSITSLKDILRNYEKINLVNEKNLIVERTNKFATTYVKILEELINN